MNCNYACGSAEHVSRRSFLGGTAAAATGGMAMLGMPGFAPLQSAQANSLLNSDQKRIVTFFLHGGVSQLETWDPKPGTETGGPFLAIPTSVPGVHISELLPYTAQQMHHLALVRGVNTAEDDHGKGAYIMHTGRRQTPGFEYPYLGAAMSAQLGSKENPLPGNIVIGGGANPGEASFLGARHAPVAVSGGSMPANISLPGNVTSEQDARRRELRKRFGDRFASRRRAAETEIYNASYEQAAALMSQKDVFDFSKVAPEDLARYGSSDFGKQCLLARRMIEHGVTYVSVTHTNYDTHCENFNFHIEQLGEFDQPFATFISDLADRGLLTNTLVIVMSEFGRTPRINHLIGRDHWSAAWSIALAGCGIKAGAVYGKTNDNGTAVIDGQVNGGHLFHTYYKAVGLDSSKEFYDGDRPIEKADPATAPIAEILA